MKDDKIIDFGEFGQWSLGTLKAQSSVSSSFGDGKYKFVILPPHIDTINSKLGNEKFRILQEKSKKMSDIYRWTKRLLKIDESLKEYGEIRKMLTIEMIKK